MAVTAPEAGVRSEQLDVARLERLALHDLPRRDRELVAAAPELCEQVVELLRAAAAARGQSSG
jgi:hypothetical protein